MVISSSTTSNEFLAWLRDKAIAGGMPPLFIDQIDRLQSTEELEAELEKTGDELASMEDARDDLLDELRTITEHMETALDTIASVIKSPADATEMCDAGEMREMQRYLDFAKKALERHEK